MYITPSISLFTPNNNNIHPEILVVSSVNGDTTVLTHSSALRSQRGLLLFRGSAVRASAVRAVLRLVLPHTFDCLSLYVAGRHFVSSWDFKRTTQPNPPQLSPAQSDSNPNPNPNQTKNRTRTKTKPKAKQSRTQQSREKQKQSEAKQCKTKKVIVDDTQSRTRLPPGFAHSVP